ncbi:B-cell receptor CD22 [Merluccius polli]|uniref:B-cell receptor CD22 n=1 Tax=Merluccius polli TaxID=89951 RepID=A0AA47MUI8_MERPO|nr:B-cell receptor CD22 [Merluccius polli]
MKCNSTDAPKTTSATVSPSGEIEEGRSVTLSCSSDANPAANYTWFKVNTDQSSRDMIQGQQLVFGAILSSDSGQYLCKAKNELGTTSDSISINVKYGPKNTSVISSPSGEIEEGRSVTLSCSSDANPAANYTWFKEHEDLVGESGQNYTIIHITSQLGGNYYCQAHNAVGRHNSTFLFIHVTALQGNDDWTVTYTSSNVCSLRGSTVDITCTYQYPYKLQYRSSPVETLWFTKEDNKQPVDLLSDTDYAGRVEYTCGEISCYWYNCRRCTLRIRDLRQSDSAVYKFRFITNQPGGQYTGEPGVKLSVTVYPTSCTCVCVCVCVLEGESVCMRFFADLQVKVIPSSWLYWVNLNCDSTCYLSGYPAYIWYKNGQSVGGQTTRDSGGKLNSEDSYSCAVKGYEHVHSPLVCVRGDRCNRVSYPTRNMCVLRGTSVDIFCTYNSYEALSHKYWFKWRRYQQPWNLQTEYGGRVEYPAEETGRSTLRITDLRDTDSAEYRFTFRSSSHEWKGTFHGTTLTVTDLRMEVTPVAMVTEGQRVTLTCMTSCPLTDKPSYMWYQNNGPVTGPESPENQLVLDPVSPRHAGNYACSVRNYPHLRSPEETLTVQCTMSILHHT